MHQRAILFCEIYEGYYLKNTKTTGQSEDPRLQTTSQFNTPKNKQNNRVGNQEVLETTLQDLERKENVEKKGPKDLPNR